MNLVRLRYTPGVDEWRFIGYSKSDNPCVIMLLGAPPLCNPPSFSLSSTDWETIDAIALGVPSHATGVVVRLGIPYQAISWPRKAAVRMFGSTNSFYWEHSQQALAWMHIGLSGGKFQARCEAGGAGVTTYGSVRIMGYTTDEVDWRSNALAFASTPGAWTICDTGRSDAGAAFVAMFRNDNGAVNPSWGLRPYGGTRPTRTHTAYLSAGTGLWEIVGLVDGKFEYYNCAAGSVYVNGFISDRSVAMFPDGLGKRFSSNYTIDDAPSDFEHYDLAPFSEGASVAFMNYADGHSGGLAPSCVEYNALSQQFASAPSRWLSHTALVRTTSLGVTTLDATGVGDRVATLNGEVLGDVNHTVFPSLERGFDLYIGGMWRHAWSESGVFSAGAFEYTLPSLYPGTTYTYRAKARNAPLGTSDTWSYGAPASFTTLVSTGASCAVDTLPATNVANNRARLNGHVGETLGQYVSVGFEYGTKALTEYGNKSEVKHGYTNGDDFYVDIGSLAEGVVYHFRAYMVLPTRNGNGIIVYGGDKTFSTDSSLGAITWVDEVMLEELR